MLKCEKCGLEEPCEFMKATSEDKTASEIVCCVCWDTFYMPKDEISIPCKFCFERYEKDLGKIWTNAKKIEEITQQFYKIKSVQPILGENFLVFLKEDQKFKFFELEQINEKLKEIGSLYGKKNQDQTIKISHIRNIIKNTPKTNCIVEIINSNQSIIFLPFDSFSLSMPDMR